jgi:RHS repeat-associated protein
LSYGYDADNNVHTITDNVTPANNQTLTWDVIDRLTGATGSYAAESVTYDSSSNRLTFSGSGITRYANTDRMKKWAASAVTYDSAGSMTGFSTYVMTYSKANRLATANPFGTVNTYWYDAFGNRPKVKVGTFPFAVLIYDLWGNLLTETSVATTPVETDYVYLDDMQLSAIQPAAATISAIHTDRIGTPQVATNAAKTVVWTGNYTPFGAITASGSITQNLRLPGMYQDHTVFYHNGFRDHFSTGYGGYIEADPLDLRARLFSNDYNYANQNPMKYIDPSGLTVVSLLGGFNAPMSLWVSTGPLGGINLYDTNHVKTLTSERPTQQTEIGSTGDIGFSLAFSDLSGTNGQYASTNSYNVGLFGKFSPFGVSITPTTAWNSSLPWYDPRQYIDAISFNWGLAFPFPLGSPITVSSPANTPASPAVAPQQPGNMPQPTSASRALCDPK